jgi:hypothetical protein
MNAVLNQANDPPRRKVLYDRLFEATTSGLIRIFDVLQRPTRQSDLATRIRDALDQSNWQPKLTKRNRGPVATPAGHFFATHAP